MEVLSTGFFTCHPRVSAPFVLSWFNVLVQCSTFCSIAHSIIHSYRFEYESCIIPSLNKALKVWIFVICKLLDYINLELIKWDSEWPLFDHFLHLDELHATILAKIYSSSVCLWFSFWKMAHGVFKVPLCDLTSLISIQLLHIIITVIQQSLLNVFKHP